MTPPDLSHYISLKHAATFQCIGPACEEDCCHGWAVVLKQTDYQTMEAQLTKTAAGRLQFYKNVKKRQKKQSAAAYADIVLGDDGVCPFQDPVSKLCTIHRDFGASCLSQTCRTYPRALALVGNHFELSLALSCPEATRRFLFDPDFDLIQVEQSPFATGDLEFTSYPVDESNPLSQYVDLVRDTVLQLLTESNYPLSSRLFFSCFFANRTVPFFSRQKELFSETRLLEEIQRQTEPQVLATLDKQFQSLACEEALSIDLPMSFILAILLERTQKTGPLTDLLHKVWHNYGLGDSTVPPAQRDTQQDCANIITAYKKMRATTPQAVTEQIDSYLDRYSQYFWFSHLYTRSPNLLIHTRSLFIRLALLRFLLYSHPAMIEFRHLANSATLSGQQHETIAQVAVEVFFRLSRGLEHAPALLTGIEEIFDRNGMLDIEHVCMLLLI